MVLRKFSEITNNKTIFSQPSAQYFWQLWIFPFQASFWSLFNRRQRSQSNQEQCSLCCSSPCFLVLLCTHYRPLQCFSTYFHKSKEIGVLRPILPDYVISISCGCDGTIRFFFHICHNEVIKGKTAIDITVIMNCTRIVIKKRVLFKLSQLFLLFAGLY